MGRLSLREGLNALKSAGIILSVRGKGTFVACSSDHIADTLNGLMAIPNLVALLGLSGVVAVITKDYFAKVDLQKERK